LDHLVLLFWRENAAEVKELQIEVRSKKFHLPPAAITADVELCSAKMVAQRLDSPATQLKSH
jgi:hypothetical protein